MISEIKKLYKLYISEHNFTLLGTLCVIIFNSSISVATPFAIGFAIDTYIEQARIDDMKYLIVGLMLLYIASAGLNRFQTMTIGTIAQSVLYKLRQDLFAVLQYVPLSFYEEYNTGDIVSRVSNDTEKINNFLGQYIFQFVGSFFTFTGIGVLIFILHWQLALLVWSAVIVVTVLSQMTRTWTEKINETSLATVGEANSFIEDNLSNFRVISVYNQRQYLRDSFHDINQTLQKNSRKALVVNGLFNPLYTFAGNIAQVLVLLSGLILLSQGSISIGLLVSFIAYTQKFYEPLRVLGSVWGALQEALAAWNRVLPILDKIKT